LVSIIKQIEKHASDERGRGGTSCDYAKHTNRIDGDLALFTKALA
jgi:hypothetical protein